MKIYRYQYFVLALSFSMIGEAAESCWQHKIPSGTGPENIATLCIDGEVALMSVYYPNNGASPTNCEQSGRVQKVENERTLIDFERGACENGRNLQANSLTCKPDELNLNCQLNKSDTTFKFAPYIKDKVSIQDIGNTETKSYYLKGYGLFEIDIPSTWLDSVEQPSLSIPPTIRLTPKQGDPFVILVSPIWPENADVPLPTKSELSETLGSSVEIAQATASETEININSFAGADKFGFYFNATDAAPEPGGFKYLSQGIFAIGPIRVTFTILTNDKQEAVVKKGLDMLKGAKYIPSQQ